MSGIFVERKQRLDGRAPSEFACELVERRPDRVVLRYVLTEAWTVSGVDLPAGTVTLAYYWPDRPCNVYHWLAPDGRSIAQYVNVSGPLELGPDWLAWEDWIVDVLVLPGGRLSVLDLDEIPDDLAPEARDAIATALEETLAAIPWLVEETSVASTRFFSGSTA